MLDVLGQLFILLVLVYFPILTGLSLDELSLERRSGWLKGILILYLVFSWLLGSCTVLQWRQLPLVNLYGRVLLAIVATVAALAVCRWVAESG